MTTPENLTPMIDAITDALRAGELHNARHHFNRALQSCPTAVIVKRLAATVDIPKQTIVWGPGIYVWANPHRRDHAWRCGDCRWTGSNYTTGRAARNAAVKHANDHRLKGGPVPVLGHASAANHARCLHHEGTR